MNMTFIFTRTEGVVSERSRSLPPLTGTCDHCGGSAERGEEGVLRCACGSLLARRVPEGIELKCRRCKRTVVIPVRADEVDALS